MRQARNYGALHETHREVEETPSQTVSREPRAYGAVRQTQWQLDEQQQSRAEASARPPIVRSWTHYGGMVPQQELANDWIKQNDKSRMSDSGKGMGGRQGSPSPDRQQNDAELQQARSVVEEARRREAARRERQQEHERGGPER